MKRSGLQGCWFSRGDLLWAFLLQENQQKTVENQLLGGLICVLAF